MKQTITDWNNVDTEHMEKREVGGCRINLFFSLIQNQAVENNVLENLLDSFERRANDGTGLHMTC